MLSQGRALVGQLPFAFQAKTGYNEWQPAQVGLGASGPKLENAMDDDPVRGEIEPLVGKSAGQICYHEFLHESLLAVAIASVAHALWESLRSAWILIEVWNNGATFWRSPEGDETATVPPHGEIQVAPWPGRNPP